MPVLDISGDPRRVADEIGAACRDLGFLTVTGHGVPEDVVERTGQVARTFFDLPDGDKGTLAEGEAQPEDAPGGPQVQTRSGDWLDVRAVPGSFVVNLGDMMARWTNGRWAATLDRGVVVPPADRAAGSRRQTIVFFHDPRADAVIECIPGCADADRPPRYEPVTALEHVRAKAAKALA